MPEEQPRRGQDLIFDVATRIVRELTNDRPTHQTFPAVAGLLRDLIEFDRFTVTQPYIRRSFAVEGDTFLENDFNNTKMQEGRSASRWVFGRGEALLRSDISRDRQFEHDDDRIAEGMLSDLIVPLVSDGIIVGTANFTKREAGSYDQSHLNRAVIVSDYIALMMKCLSQGRIIAAISRIAESVMGDANLDDVLTVTMEHIVNEGYDRARLYLYDETRDAMVGALQAGRELYGGFENVAYPVATDPYTKRTLLNGKPCIYRTDTREFEALTLRRQATGEANLGAADEWCEIPLRVREGIRQVTIGKITLDNIVSGLKLHQNRLDTLMPFASHAAIAIRHAQLASPQSD